VRALRCRVVPLGAHTRADFITDLVSEGLNPLKSPIVCGVLRI
jgi:hypothetical protein